jgi:hypothetical protein
MVRAITQRAWLLAVLTALPLVCFSQEKPFIPPVLPVANWQQAESHPLPLAMVQKYGGDPAIEQEYGVNSLELRTYQLGRKTAQVVVEPAADASSAYGLLTVYRTPAMTPEKDMELAVGDGTQILMARGSNFIRFLRGNDSSISDSDYHALLLFVGGAKPSANALTALPRPLPEKGLVPGSEKYLLGLTAAKRVLPSFRADLIGFDQGAEVQVGQYRTGKGESTFLSINYPTPQIARLRVGSLRDFLGLNHDRGEDSTYGRREGAYVFLVWKAPSPQAASALLDQFKVAESVSWDQKYTSERTFTLELVHMILAILLLTLLLVGACVVAGVLFFLSKRFAARFFPQSQWGRSDEDQLIRLNLRS